MSAAAIRRWIVALLVAVAAGAGGLGLGAQSTEPFVYRLGAGDRVKVTVFNEPDLSGEFEIDGTGHSSLPLIGPVQVDGLTLAEAEQAIRAKVRDYVKEPRVSLEVLNYRPFYILGEVNLPGSYRYVNGMSVLTAVAMGGGFSYRADKQDIRITRKSREGAVTKMKGDVTTPVLPGDVVEVGERFF
jgi:polysaccharide export outer membrane protein